MGKREFIARNVAAMFHDGDVVNLGVGIPTLASTYVPEGMTVLFQRRQWRKSRNSPESQTKPICTGTLLKMTISLVTGELPMWLITQIRSSECCRNTSI